MGIYENRPALQKFAITTFSMCSNLNSRNNSRNNPRKAQVNTHKSAFEQYQKIQPTMCLKNQQQTSPITFHTVKPNGSQACTRKNKKKYNVVSFETRVSLINLSCKQGYSISRASRQLGIKLSTGKFIVKSFRDQGKIMKKGFEGDENQLIPNNREKLPARPKKILANRHISTEEGPLAEAELENPCQFSFVYNPFFGVSDQMFFPQGCYPFYPSGVDNHPEIYQIYNPVIPIENLNAMVVKTEE